MSSTRSRASPRSRPTRPAPGRTSTRGHASRALAARGFDRGCVVLRQPREIPEDERAIEGAEEKRQASPAEAWSDPPWFHPASDRHRPECSVPRGGPTRADGPDRVPPSLPCARVVPGAASRVAPGVSMRTHAREDHAPDREGSLSPEPPRCFRRSEVPVGTNFVGEHHAGQTIDQTRKRRRAGLAGARGRHRLAKSQRHTGDPDAAGYRWMRAAAASPSRGRAALGLSRALRQLPRSPPRTCARRSRSLRVSDAVTKRRSTTIVPGVTVALKYPRRSPS